MAENIIYCYSGAGHCLDMAKRIAKVLGDTDIVMMRAFPVKTDATEVTAREYCNLHGLWKA